MLGQVKFSWLDETTWVDGHYSICSGYVATRRKNLWQGSALLVVISFLWIITVSKVMCFKTPNSVCV